MTEVWKDIPGYEGLYEAGSHGRVRSKEGKVTYNNYRGKRRKRVWKSRVLKEKNPNRKGKRRDKRVDLWKNGKPKTLLVARIIATTFLDNPKNLETVNHVDGDHRNNRIDNLEWSSRIENNRHAFNNGLMGTNKITILEDEEGNTEEFVSMAQASQHLGRNTSYISNQLQRGNDNATSTSGEEYKIKVL